MSTASARRIVALEEHFTIPALVARIPEEVIRRRLRRY